MSVIRQLLVLSMTSFAVASPIKDDVVARANNCGTQNPILLALGAGAETSATAFCSSYLAVSTHTSYVTVTTVASESTTITITTGTEVDTAPTSTATEISSTTTTTVTSITSDDTAPTPNAIVAERDNEPRAPARLVLPPALTSALSRLAAPILSSACSCLSIPTPSTTITRTVSSTVSSTSTTSTFETTTTFTPVASTSTTDTETATSTSIILKSDVLASIVAAVNDGGYQSFCSDILDYTTPVTTVWATATATTSTTTTQTGTSTQRVFVTVTNTVGANAKRQEAASDPTPAPLASYPADYITSGCFLAVTSPGTLTISSTLTQTTTSTIVEKTTLAVQATSTATVNVIKYPLTNGDFETGSISPWNIWQTQAGQPNGVWSVQPGDGSAQHGAYVLQVDMLNTNTQYGPFGSWVWQTFDNLVIGQRYTLTFDYRCTQFGTANVNTWIQAQVPGLQSAHLTCATAGTWYSGALSWTTDSTSGYVYLVVQQGGYTEGIYQFDNVVVQLN